MSLTGSLYVNVTPESPYQIDLDPDTVEIVGDGFGTFSPSALHAQTASLADTASFALTVDTASFPNITASFGQLEIPVLQSSPTASTPVTQSGAPISVYGNELYLFVGGVWKSASLF